MAKVLDDPVPLKIACRQAGLGYFRGWRAVTAGRVPARRDPFGNWWVRPSDLETLACTARRPSRAAT